MSEAKLLNQGLIYTNDLNKVGYPPAIQSNGKLNNNILPDNIVYTENGKISQDILPSGTGKQIGDICIFLKDHDPGDDYLESGEPYNSAEYPELAQMFGSNTNSGKYKYQEKLSLSSAYTYKYKQAGDYDFIIAKDGTGSSSYSSLYYKKNNSTNLSFKIYESDIGSSFQLVDVIYDGAKYVLLFKSGNSFSIEISNDLIDWTRYNYYFNNYYHYNSMLYKNGKYYIACTHDSSYHHTVELLISEDLKTWNSKTISESGTDTDGRYNKNISNYLIYELDKYYFILNKNQLFYSEDLDEWQSFSNWPTWSTFDSDSSNTSLTSIKKIEDKYLILGSLNKRFVFFWIDNLDNINDKTAWNLVQVSEKDEDSSAVEFANNFTGLKDIIKYNNKYYTVGSSDPESYYRTNNYHTYSSNNLLTSWEKKENYAPGGVGLQIFNNNKSLIIYGHRQYYYIYTDGQYNAPEFGTTTGDAKMYIKAR